MGQILACAPNLMANLPTHKSSQILKYATDQVRLPTYKSRQLLKYATDQVSLPT